MKHSEETRALMRERWIEHHDGKIPKPKRGPKRTPEQRAIDAAKGGSVGGKVSGKMNKNRQWYTDGSADRFIKTTEDVPTSFYPGRTFNRKKKI
jgi:hypothetical protein